MAPRTGKAPADWSKDSEVKKRERRAYWQTGWAVGPDTVMGALWVGGVLAAASADATCWPSTNGLSSGADGESCTLAKDWNQSYFEAVGGAACEGKDFLGAVKYFRDPRKLGCIEAFDAYRSETGYACNCSGNNDPHSFLGKGGLRPSVVYTQMYSVATLVIAIAQFLMGAYTDFIGYRLKVWWVLAMLCGVCTLGMAVLGPDYIWVVGLCMAALTQLFSEMVLPIRMSYLEDVADEMATTGYVAAMRLSASYTSQLLLAIVYLALTFVFPDDDILNAQIVAAFAGVWFLIFMPMVLLKFTEHGPKRTNDSGKRLLTLVFRESFDGLVALRKYPEAMKVLALNAIMQMGGPVIIATSSQYALSYLEMSSTFYGITVIMVLLLGIPGAYALGVLRRKDLLSYKLAYAIDLSIFLLIDLLPPLVAHTPTMTSWVIVIVLAGIFGGVALSWYYSLGWSSFVLLIPENNAGTFAGIFQAINTAFSFLGPQIYTFIVQGTNSHRLAWGSSVIWVILSLIILYFVDFEKGLRESGRPLAGKGPAVTAPVAAAVDA